MRRTLGIAWLGLFASYASAQPSTEPGPAPREFRAAWVATVDNIDWPSRKGLPVERQRAELDAILDRARELRLNALIFQVRPGCDALYRSPLEPWAEWLTGAQGAAPRPLWDPLQHAITGAARRGLELHAWFNPFRARHRAATSRNASNHVSRIPGMCVTYGKQLWMDPGNPAAREHSLKVILDVVERYDIDGVHIDDYFYPYPENGQAFPDEGSYRRYRDGGGGLHRDDWRRANVDGFIKDLHRGIKQRKTWVKFGISPFGIARPGVPRGIEAGIDQYGDLYADVVSWWRQGWCDYLSPQLYWPIAQRAQSYPVLLDFWARENVKGRHLWIGNYTSRVVNNEKPWPLREILDQIDLTRRQPGATGNVHFSMKALLPGVSTLGAQLERGPYVEPALVPASPWLDDEPPDAPSVTVGWTRDGDVELRWSRADDERRTVYLYCGRRWRLADVLAGGRAGMRIKRDQLRALRVGAVAVAAVDRCGNESARVIRGLER